jgi:signal transduction histidine kinase
MDSRTRSRLHFVGAIIWVALTVSLASWWLYFGLQQARELRALRVLRDATTVPDDITRRMLGGEGAMFITLLVGGGLALLYSVRKEQRRQREIEAFFMAFTHDLKTALASLQVQAESLQEDLPDAAGNPNLERLLKDSVRLQLQLENSLFFAQPDGSLLPEPIAIRDLVTRTAADWPELIVTVAGEAKVLADARGVESVFRNLFQNAVVHGDAARMTVRIERRPTSRVAVTATDDGKGAEPAVVKTLGLPFVQRTKMSGTVVGLFVSTRLVQRMNGALGFSSAPGAGFTAVIDLPAAP